MSDRDIYNLLGLIQKAGRLLSGNEQIETGLKDGKGELLVMAEDAAERTTSLYRGLAERQKVPVVIFGKKEELGRAIGKGVRTAVLITDQGFSRTICRKLEGVCIMK